jgi:ethanolamine ammonia-lyase small subunit
MAEFDDKLARDRWIELERKVRSQTPARLLQGRSGQTYRTETQIELREAHAAARDAVQAEFSLSIDLDSSLVRDWKLFEVHSQATNKEEYLLRPDLGRRLSEYSRPEIVDHCSKNADLQIVIGDGLSVTAVIKQVPALLPLLRDQAVVRGWRLGTPFVVHYCRVGILNEIGDLLHPKVVVLLIGERPGLATAESLSAYMAYKPKSGDTDANRNLISNIHERGVPPADAAPRIVELAAAMVKARMSGCLLREESHGLE